MASTFHFGSSTATAGTAIVRTIPGKTNRYVMTSHVRYKPGTTAHTVTILQSLATTTVASTAAQAQPDVVLTADPGGLVPASGDYMIFAKPNGTLFTSTVSSWNAGTLTVTLVDNVPTGGLSSGATAWFFGVPGDQTDNQYSTTASTESVWQDNNGIHVSPSSGAPVIIHSNNATAAGTLIMVHGVYSNVA